MLKLIKLSF